MSDMNKLPTQTTMYQALMNRDTTFEGVFWVAVKSTGIFCRPTCHSKKPKLENVEFFATSGEALYAGYRPCLRCRPLDQQKQAPELVLRLSQEIEKAPSGKISDVQLRAMGIDPSTARRQFKRYYGMTFQAYHRARRMGLALHEIRRGESVIGAQLDQGFESASGFWEAFRQVFGIPPSQAADIKYLLARWIDTPLGAMLALANDDGIHLLEFVDRRGLENEIKLIRKRTGCFIVPGTIAHLENIADEIQRYFDGKNIDFSTPIVIGGTQFEKSVWKLLQTIPPGDTWSYSQMAKKLGKPSATRAVGRANVRNCLAIVIPCHRVIRSDGSLCGYGGGIWRKKWLLDHEQKIIGSHLKITS
jgi:AraC family transcriptional regulator, regulatory protein of adaptative response / methylated-DNA-[protein]-cysteine methyltransferase